MSQCSLPTSRSGSPPRTVGLLASRLLRSLVDIVDHDKRRERRLSKADRRRTVTLTGGAAVRSLDSMDRNNLMPSREYDSGISSSSLVFAGHLDCVPSSSRATVTSDNSPQIERRRCKTSSSFSFNRFDRRRPINWSSIGRLFQPRERSMQPDRPAFDRQISEPATGELHPVTITITDPMGAVSSRERRTSSAGCWSYKNRQTDGQYAPEKPSKLKLDVDAVHRPGFNLPTPTDSEGETSPIAQSSNERIMNIIRCFPFPSPRPSPKASPRLKRKSFGEADQVEKPREIKKKDRRCESVEAKSVSPSQDSGNGTAESSYGEDGSYRHVMGQLVQVSVETMAITALPKESIDCWLKERLKKWIQLSGHEGSIIPASCNSLYKKQTGLCTEGKAYQAIQDDPALAGFAPKFYQVIEKNDETFIEIEDLLSRFSDPSQTAIMDIKIGTRTFLESEVLNEKLRPDLFQKMNDIDPYEATDEERERGSITKLRYMTFRERESSSANLGFRIEAAKMQGGELKKDFKKVRTADDVATVFRWFLGKERSRVVDALLKRLIALRGAIERSQFFADHEVVGSSLLVLFDKEKVGVWMIDFAKAVKSPNCRKMTHRTPWEVGNGEDGYLTGIDSLVSILEELKHAENDVIV